MRIYVIGPITGRQNENKPAFEEAAARLRAAGHEVTMPHDLVDDDDELKPLWEHCMRKSLQHIVSAWDIENEPPRFAITQLPDWAMSKGARVETELARLLGIPCAPVGWWLGERGDV